MKNLEDIPKNHPFKVPDEYFEKLPGVIQSRIAAKSGVREPKPYFTYALRYALPAIVLGVVALYYFKADPKQDAESLLASVSTEELVAYLGQSDITTEELIESAEFDAESIEAIESEAYFSFDLDENTLPDDMNMELDTL